MSVAGLGGTATGAPEFSRPVRIDTVGEGGRAFRIEADAAERAALAGRFGLLGLASLVADISVARSGERISLDGRMRAQVEQPCVASGEPVAATIEEPFVLRFLPEADDAPAADEEVELGEADLDVIGYRGGAIDAGEAVAQTLALALDPFPRAPNADAALKEAGVTDGADASPFAVLKALREPG